MARFLTGAQVSSPFTLKAPYGLDSRSSANTVEEVLTQYPASCRYLGMKVFIEEENKYYVFSKHPLGDGTMSTGLTDDDFKPFETDGNIMVDGVLSDTSQNPVENRIITTQMNTLQKKLVIGENMDETPLEDSELPVSSGGVARALAGLRGSLNYKGFYSSYSELLTVTDMVQGDWVTISADETHNGEKSKYIYSTEDGWVYNGEVAETHINVDDESISDSSVWSSSKTNEEIEKQHQPYEAGIPLVSGEYYVESRSLYKCLQDVLAEDNTSFTLLPEGTMELVIGNGDIKSCEYDELSETLYLNHLTMDSIDYNEDTMTLSIFEI